MLWIALSAFAAPVLEEAPAHLAGLGSWEDRLAHLEAGHADAAEDEQARWALGMRIVRTLAKYHPDTATGDIRLLVRAAMSEDAVMAREAVKAAWFGLPLPERQAGSDWVPSLPAPVRRDPPIRFTVTADPALGDAASIAKSLEDHAVKAGWKLDPKGPEIQVEVAAPHASEWGVLGRAVTAKVTLSGGETAQFEGFAAGPPTTATQEHLLRTLWGNVLAYPLAPDLADRPAPPDARLPALESGEVCIARPPSNAQTPLQLDVGEGFALDLMAGEWLCTSLPVGMELSAEHGRHTVAAGTQWLLLDPGEQQGWARLEAVDAKRVAKWKDKARIREVETEPVPK